MRRVGYGAIGLTIGIIIYIMLLVNAPSGVTVRSSIIEFDTGNNVVNDNDDYIDEYIERYIMLDNGEYIFDEEGDYMLNEYGEFVPYEEYISEGYMSDEEDYMAGSIVPFLEYGSYHISVNEFASYEKNGTVKYGKPNPTFYHIMETPSDDLEDLPEWIKEIDLNNDGVISIEEAEKAGYTMPIDENHRLYTYMRDADKDGVVGEKDDVAPDRKDVVELGGKSQPETLEGFNIHTRENESMDVSKIKQSFKQYGRLPVDREHYNISSGFGVRVDPWRKSKAFHVGSDFATTTIDGANVYAAVHGEVVESVEDPDDKDGFGNYIVVKHDGFETIYAHLKSKPLFEVGDKVHAGDIIGYVGTTGRSTGPHLHFEVGIGGVKFNPIVFINEIERAD